MSESNEGATVVELLLREPEIVAWLEDYRPPQPRTESGDSDDGDPPAAA